MSEQTWWKVYGAFCGAFLPLALKLTTNVYLFSGLCLFVIVTFIVFHAMSNGNRHD